MVWGGGGGNKTGAKRERSRITSSLSLTAAELAKNTARCWEARSGATSKAASYFACDSTGTQVSFPLVVEVLSQGGFCQRRALIE